ncbi:CS012 protein, partial [Irena cyanogastra]|nr:CS012 protein [Irena cyanogastra]
LGGAMGGLIGWITSGQFKPVSQILMELPAAEKQKLCARAMAVVKNLVWIDATQLIALVMSNSALRNKVLGVLVSYLTSHLKVEVKFGE